MRCFFLPSVAGLSNEQTCLKAPRYDWSMCYLIFASACLGVFVGPSVQMDMQGTSSDTGVFPALKVL